jgi:hypothetical protein
LIVACALTFASCVVIDAGYGNRSAIRVDANGAPAIVEGVLSLRGRTRQQKGGDRKKLFHRDLLGRWNLNSEPYARVRFRYVT